MTRGKSPFLIVWTLAVMGASTAFVVHLATRAKTLASGYELGAAHSRLARLREVKRVLELERASLETPARVDLVARTLFAMGDPTADRMLSGGPLPTLAAEMRTDTGAPPGPGGGDVP